MNKAEDINWSNTITENDKQLDLKGIINDLRKAELGDYFTKPHEKVLETLEFKPTDTKGRIEMDIDIPLDNFKVKGIYNEADVIKLLENIHETLPGDEAGLREIAVMNRRRKSIEEFKTKQIPEELLLDINESIKSLKEAELGGYFENPHEKVIKTMEIQPTGIPNQLLVDINIPLDHFKIKGLFNAEDLKELLDNLKRTLPSNEAGLREIAIMDARRKAIDLFKTKRTGQRDVVFKSAFKKASK